jgi:hypothetical protein
MGKPELLADHLIRLEFRLDDITSSLGRLEFPQIMYGGCIADDPYRDHRREGELNVTIERIAKRITRAAEIKTMVEESLGNPLGDIPAIVELEQMLTKSQEDLVALKERMYGWIKPIIDEISKPDPARDEILASVRKALG